MLIGLWDLLYIEHFHCYQKESDVIAYAHIIESYLLIQSFQKRMPMTHSPKSTP